MNKCANCYLFKNNDKYQLYKGKPNGWCRDCKSNIVTKKLKEVKEVKEP